VPECHPSTTAAFSARGRRQCAGMSLEREWRSGWLKTADGRDHPRELECGPPVVNVPSGGATRGDEDVDAAARDAAPRLLIVMALFQKTRTPLIRTFSQGAPANRMLASASSQRQSPGPGPWSLGGSTRSRDRSHFGPDSRSWRSGSRSEGASARMPPRARGS
jgi:hypothetical protein